MLEFFEAPSIDSAVGSGAAAATMAGAVTVAVWITVAGRWGLLWRDRLTSGDPRKIGVMYMVIGFMMFARGIFEGVIMRTHQATALDGGFISDHHWAELFSTLGIVMIFFVAMAFITGVMNSLIPLRIGASDMAFPMLNQISLCLTATESALTMISLVMGAFETGGWSVYPTFTGAAAFDPGPGPDCWVRGIVLSGFGSMFSGLNFAVTINKMRCPGMTHMRMPIFVWTARIAPKSC